MPDWEPEIRTRLLGLNLAAARESEIVEEVSQHLDDRYEDLLSHGRSEEEAKRLVLAELSVGDLFAQELKRTETQIDRKPHALSVGKGNHMENFLPEVRYAFRVLRKSPGFTAVAILTVALGIGANTAIFSVVDQLMVRPLPVRDPERLALLGQPRQNGRTDFEFNYPLFREFQQRNHVFSELAGITDRAVGIRMTGGTEQQPALLVSGNYFRMLGVEAALGRMFSVNEGVEIDDAAVVVLSYGLWQRMFGADPTVIGRVLTINTKPFTIIGVAPREFRGTTRGAAPELYVPITMAGQLSEDRAGGEHPLKTRFLTWIQACGRLNEGVTLQQAKLGMELLARQIYAVTPANTGTNLAVLPGAQGFTDNLQDARLPLRLLFGTAGLVLLIACANLANLQLARAAGRKREFAIRLALGARRGQLIRELLTESTLVSVIGGVLGLGVAFWLVGFLSGFRPRGAAIEIATATDVRVLAFTLVAAVGTGIIFGLAPAFRASRTGVVSELKGADDDSARGRSKLRSGLAIAQIALSLLVLACAGLCIRSVKKLQALNPGFEPAQVALMSLDLKSSNFDHPRAQLFYNNLLERVRRLPGVEAASLAANTPLNGRSWGMSIGRIEGVVLGPNERPSAEFNIVSDDYFRSLRATLLRGREFKAEDTATSLKSVIVNDAFVRRFWKDQDPIGKQIFQPGPTRDGTAVQVVGVVAGIRSRLTQAPRPAIYFPVSQSTESGLTLVVRTGFDLSATIGSVRAVVKSLDSNVPVFAVQTLEQQKNTSLALDRMAAVLLTGFGALALFLAALGIYGVLAYMVKNRTREIGVRMAIGAQISDVLALVLRQGLGLAGAGIGLGLLGAFAATRFLRGFLYDVKPLDPFTFAAVTILLSSIALLACLLPARRAARVDPIQALRYE